MGVIFIKRLMIILLGVMLLVACGGKEEQLSPEELKKDIKELKEEQIELHREMNSDDEEAEEVIEETTEEVEEPEPEEELDELQDNIDEIEYKINNVVDADLDNTSITKLRVNADASVDEERYIVLVDLEWDVKNKPKMTKEMLDMYSDHLAAKVADNELVYELVMFWTVPYHNEDESILKRTYENRDGGMFLEDEMKDVNVFD